MKTSQKLMKRDVYKRQEQFYQPHQHLFFHGEKQEEKKADPAEDSEKLCRAVGGVRECLQKELSHVWM